MNGFLLINKPAGPTSHDIIYQLRKITGIKQIGHSGTLDPFASGLLLIGIVEATKLLGHYVGLYKEYEATLKLGATSDTHDRTGKITNAKSDVKLSKAGIQKVLKSFTGKQKQIPPMHSAKKIKGQRLYKLARAGKKIKRKPHDIEIYDINLIWHKGDELKIKCHVSSGTYIRALAHDIGQKLGCGAYLEKLQRTAIGDFKLKDALTIRQHDKVQSLPRTLSRALIRDRFGDEVLSCIIPMKTVLVAGTFNGAHKGHREFFKQAREHGHRLFAIVARDKTVEKIKKRAPKYSEKERIKQVKACEEIDRVYLGSKDNPVDFALSLNPDIIALGYDQKFFIDELQEEIKNRRLDIKVVRLNPHHPEKFKSSIINK